MAAAKVENGFLFLQQSPEGTVEDVCINGGQINALGIVKKKSDEWFIQAVVNPGTSYLIYADGFVPFASREDAIVDRENILDLLYIKIWSGSPYKLADDIEADKTSSSKAATPKAVYNFVNETNTKNYKVAGSLDEVELVVGLLVEANEGNVYNIAEPFTTYDDLFVQEDGTTFPKGTNVVIIENPDTVGEYLFDVLAGFVDLDPVTIDNISYANHEITIELKDTTQHTVNIDQGYRPSLTIEEDDAFVLESKHVGNVVLCDFEDEITVPEDDDFVEIPLNSDIALVRIDEEITIVPEGAVTINGGTSSYTIPNAYGSAVLRRIGEHAWLLVGSYEEVE